MSVDEKKSLEDIKRLLMLLLMKLDSSSEEIGLALDVDSSRIRQMIPTKKVKRIVATNQEK